MARIKKHLNFPKNNKFYFGIVFLIIALIILSFYSGRIYSSKQSKESGPQDLTALYNFADTPPSDFQKEVPSDEDRTLLGAKLKEIFPDGWEKTPEEERIIKIEQFISTMKLQDNLGTATKILQDGYANCGGMAYAFRILVRAAGLPARYNALFNAPGMGGHNLTEVYYDNAWHLFDPTFGIFVYSEPNYNKKGRILAMSELRENSQSGYLQQVVVEPWLGNYSSETQKFIIKQIPDKYLGQYSWITSNFDIYWRSEIKSAFPVAYSAQNWVSQPIDIDLASQNSFSIGQKDQKSFDISALTWLFHGSSYLGKTRDIPGAYHTFTVKSSAPRNIVVRYWPVGKSANVNLNVVRLRGVQLIGIDNLSDHFDIHLRILNDPAIFMVFLDQGVIEIDAIEVIEE